jgi:hypothetical protein
MIGPTASSRVSNTPSEASFEGGGRGTREAGRGLRHWRGRLSPNNCQRSEAEERSPCSKLQGIHKFKEAR